MPGIKGQTGMGGEAPLGCLCSNFHQAAEQAGLRPAVPTSTEIYRTCLKISKCQLPVNPRPWFGVCEGCLSSEAFGLRNTVFQICHSIWPFTIVIVYLWVLRNLAKGLSLQYIHTYFMVNTAFSIQARGQNKHSLHIWGLQNMSNREIGGTGAVLAPNCDLVLTPVDSFPSSIRWGFSISGNQSELLGATLKACAI